MENVYLTDVRFYPNHGYISFVVKIIEDGKFVSLPATFRFTTDNALTRGLSKSNFTATINRYGCFCDNKVLARLNDVTYLSEEFRIGYTGPELSFYQFARLLKTHLLNLSF